MAEREPRLRADTVEWLLEEDNPSVRYLTLRHLLGRKEGDAEVEKAKGDIMRVGPVPKILAKQNAEGHWGRPEDFYMRSKYQGTIWNLIVLAELHADPEDERVRRACESVLKWSQNPASGGFSTLGTAEKGGRPEMEIPCLTANMAFSMVRLGMLDDPRVSEGLALDSPLPAIRYPALRAQGMAVSIRPLLAKAHLPLVRSQGLEGAGRGARREEDEGDAGDDRERQGVLPSPGRLSERSGLQGGRQDQNGATSVSH